MIKVISFDIGGTLLSDFLKPRENDWQTLYYCNNIDSNIHLINELTEIFNYLKE